MNKDKSIIMLRDKFSSLRKALESNVISGDDFIKLRDKVSSDFSTSNYIDNILKSGAVVYVLTEIHSFVTKKQMTEQDFKSVKSWIMARV